MARKLSSRFVVVSSLALLLNAGGWVWMRYSLTHASPQSVRIMQALPDVEADAAEALSLVFDEPLVGEEQVGRRAEQPLFEIKPAPDGHWEWERPDTLAFRLARPLPAGRVFRVQPVADFQERSGRRIVGESAFEFRTRPLRWLDCRVERQERDHVDVRLAFNQAVIPEQLLARLSLLDDGKPIAARPVSLTDKPSETVILRCSRPQSKSLRVRIDNGLTGVDGELPLWGPESRTVGVDRVFVLTRADAEPPSFDGDAEVTLDFSYDLDRSQTLPAVDVQPAVAGLKTERSWCGLRLRGAFECGRKYTATVPGNLLSEDGRTLGQPQGISFEIPDRHPRIAFPLSRGALSPQGNLTLDLRAVNVSGIELQAWRIYANNIVPYLSREETDDTAREVVKRRITLQGKRNTPETVGVDLSKLLDANVGVYQLRARATDRSWTYDTATVAITDLGITAKRDKAGYLVWVTSLRTAKPLAGVEVTALSHANQTLDTALTDEQGVARLLAPLNHPDGPPWLITARKRSNPQPGPLPEREREWEDLSFLQPDERPWVIDDVDLEGRPVTDTYDVMLYSERGVYRPGDTVHLTGVIRDAMGAAPPVFPLTVLVKRPDGRRVAELAATPGENGQGMFHVDYLSETDGQTGPYRFIATLPGGKDPLGETAALVEAFLPVRLAIKATTTQERYDGIEKPTVLVNSRYLFDKPAAGLEAAVRAEYELTPFESKAYPDYQFDDAALDSKDVLKPITAALDGAGEAKVELPRPMAAPLGQWRCGFGATVTETGGRSVSTGGEFVVDTAARHIGLRIATGAIAAVGEKTRVEWVQVDAGDEPIAAAPFHVELFQVLHDNTLREVDHRYVWETKERLVPVMKRWTVEVAADDDRAAIRDSQRPPRPPLGRGCESGEFEILCESSGGYRLVVTHAVSEYRATLDFHAADAASDDSGTPLDHAERLEVVLNQDKYAPGQQLEALVRGPFEGTLFATLETHHVVSQFVLPTTGKATLLRFPLPDDIRGSAFLTATVVRPVDPSEEKWLPHRAVGMARIAVNHESRRVAVQMQATSSAEPGQTIDVSVCAGPPADPTHPGVVHLWAVDEGILLTTAFKTPDPFGHFFAPRRAEVMSADSFEDLLPDHLRPADMTRIGADGDDEEAAEAMRRSPVSLPRITPAVVWQTVVPLGPEGMMATIVKMPEMVGAMRLMAVAVDGDNYGVAEQNVTLASPLLIESSWPRFMAPGDAASIPLKLFNSTDASLDIHPTIEIDGGIEINQLDVEQIITVPAGGSHICWMTATARDLGSVQVAMTATATTEAGQMLSARAKTSLTVRPASPLHDASRVIRLPAGESTNIQPHEGFAPESARTTVTISGSPTVDLLPAMNELSDYPYGCVEQTTSRLVAMMYAPDLLEQSRTDASRAGGVSVMIDAGIRRLWTMQTSSGGLAYWPGDPRPNAWGTCYAAGLLALARQQGHLLDSRGLNSLLQYLTERLSADGDDYNSRAQICHVLAAFDRPPTGWMASLSERLNRLDIAGRAHLAAAWLAAGRKDRAMALLDESTLNQTIVSQTGGRITSQTQQEAVLLSVLLDLDPAHPWAPVLVNRLNTARKNGIWGSTLENAVAIAALARWQLLGPQASEFTGTAQYSDAVSLTFDQTKPVQFELAAATEPLRITMVGTGFVYIVLTTEGFPLENAAPMYDRGLAVRREWLDRQGSPIEPKDLRVGDLVLARVTITAPTVSDGRIVHNVAIVDALPAGMEVENPRLATSLTDQDDEADRPDRVEFLDDRVVLFTSVSERKRMFSYPLRVVSAGQFVNPPIQASCMYDAAIASVSGGGEVLVRR